MSRKKTAYIKKSDALDCAESEGAYKAMMLISRLPAEDVKPVKHGQWIPDDNPYGRYFCSKCKNVRITFKENYCPNCGAIMDLKEGEENGLS